MVENLYIGVPIKRKIETKRIGLFSSFEEFIGNLVPKPNRSFSRKFSIECELPLKILSSGFDPDDFILRNLVEELDKLEIKVDFVSDSSFDQISTIMNYSKKSVEFPLEYQKEGYSLSINSHGVFIQGASRQGMFYAVQTLLQISEQIPIDKMSPVLTLPAMEIYDYPMLSMRGVAEDTSRGQCPTVESAKRYIDILARYKMNVYAIGYEGDNFYNEKHPKIGTTVAQFTPDEIKEINTYARERFIDLIPIYVSLGHQDNILQIPEYEHLAEFPSAQCFNVSDQRIYSLIEDYYKSICNSFSSTKAFHIGCDESYDVGVYKSKDLVERNGRSQVLMTHYKKVYDLAKKYGKEQIIMYHDIIANYDDIMKDLPKDIQVMFWDYAPKKKYDILTRIFKISKNPIILSPSHLNWCRHFPDYRSSSNNILGMIEYGKKLNINKDSDDPGIIGLLNSTWGDFNNPSFRENFIYGTVLSAAATWEIKIPNAYSVLASFLMHFFHIKEKNLIIQLTEIIRNCANLNKYYRSGPIIMPQVFYMHLFRNPFEITRKPRRYVKKYKQLEKKARGILNRLDEILPYISYNAKYLEYVHFSLKLVIALAQKEELKILTYKVANIRDIKKSHTSREYLIRKIHSFQKLLSEIIPQFEKLWLYCAKRPVLEFNLLRFQNLQKYCSEKIGELNQNLLNNEKCIQSEWISTNKINKPPTGDFYRFKFNLSEKPQIAKMLCIAGTYGRVYVNGTLIGKVFSRMSLSILPIQNRVKVFDISSLLKEGDNLIAIESYNFDNIESSFNCLIKYRIKGDEYEILSNNSWLGFSGYNPDNLDLNMVNPPENAVPVPKGWMISLSKEFDADWDHVTSFGKPPYYNGYINDENILNGVVPITEEYFGSKAWLYWAANAYLGKRLAKIGMKFYNLVKKIIRIA